MRDLGKYVWVGCVSTYGKKKTRYGGRLRSEQENEHIAIPKQHSGSAMWKEWNYIIVKLYNWIKIEYMTKEMWLMNIINLIVGQTHIELNFGEANAMCLDRALIWIARIQNMQGWILLSLMGHEDSQNN